MFKKLFLGFLLLYLLVLVYTCNCDKQLKHTLYCIFFILLILSISHLKNIENFPYGLGNAIGLPNSIGTSITDNRPYCNGVVYDSLVNVTGKEWAANNCYNIRPYDYCNGNTYENCSKENGPDWCNVNCKDINNNVYKKTIN